MATKTPSSSPSQSISLPFKTRVQVSILNFVTDAVRRTNGTINRRLMNILDRRIPPNPTPLNSVSSHDVVFDQPKNLYFRLFIPHKNDVVSTSSLPVIVFFHGGGFAFLSAASHAYDAVCRRFSRKLNAVVCSVEYRLSPEHKLPSQYDDGFSVLKFLDDAKNRRNIPQWPENADVSTLFLAGDSAGGNLAHHLAVKFAQSSSTFSLLNVVGLINIQPFFGGKERVESEVELEGAPIVSMDRTEWLWKALLPDGLDFDCWAVNVSGPNAVDISGLNLPPTVLFVGGFDPLKDWQKRYCEWLRKNEKDVKLVEYETAIHAFYVFPELPQTNLLFNEIKEFINNQISKVR
ncbi:probable carboxylesterase 18 [Beta vulgaris subsp. vulgaris]|uniref:probable carboxylesterase 18 n=1 Tax=Beta vulgaris subsp. vulgaris TaxID=3555 RepID=UPI002548AB71|nr:probable carboxylesterase 18 [Beta vulgaris subsp. vulgaris]